MESPPGAALEDSLPEPPRVYSASEAVIGYEEVGLADEKIDPDFGRRLFMDEEGEAAADSAAASDESELPDHDIEREPSSSPALTGDEDEGALEILEESLPERDDAAAESPFADSEDAPLISDVMIGGDDDADFRVLDDDDALEIEETIDHPARHRAGVFADDDDAPPATESARHSPDGLRLEAPDDRQAPLHLVDDEEDVVPTPPPMLDADDLAAPPGDERAGEDHEHASTLFVDPDELLQDEAPNAPFGVDRVGDDAPDDTPDADRDAIAGAISEYGDLIADETPESGALAFDRQRGRDAERDGESTDDLLAPGADDADWAPSETGETIFVSDDQMLVLSDDDAPQGAPEDEGDAPDWTPDPLDDDAALETASTEDSAGDDALIDPDAGSPSVVDETALRPPAPVLPGPGYRGQDRRDGDDLDLETDDEASEDAAAVDLDFEADLDEFAANDDGPLDELANAEADSDLDDLITIEEPSLSDRGARLKPVSAHDATATSILEAADLLVDPSEQLLDEQGGDHEDGETESEVPREIEPPSSILAETSARRRVVEVEAFAEMDQAFDRELGALDDELLDLDSLETEDVLEMADESHVEGSDEARLPDDDEADIEFLEEAPHRDAPDPRREERQQLVLAEGLVTQDDLHRALSEAAVEDPRLREAIVQGGTVADEDIARFVASMSAPARVTLEGLQPPASALSLVAESDARRLRALPLVAGAEVLVTAMAAPVSPDDVRTLRRLSQRRVKVLMADPDDLGAALDRCYPRSAPTRRAPTPPAEISLRPRGPFSDADTDEMEELPAAKAPRRAGMRDLSASDLLAVPASPKGGIRTDASGDPASKSDARADLGSLGDALADLDEEDDAPAPKRPTSAKTTAQRGDDPRTEALGSLLSDIDL